MKKSGWLIIGCMLFGLGWGLVVSTGDYSISWFTVDGGGGTSSGGGYEAIGSFGQLDTGSANGGPYALTSGFWAVVLVTETATATSTATPTGTPSPTGIPSPTPTTKETAVPTHTPTTTATNTTTPSLTETQSPTPAMTATAVPTNTPSPTATMPPADTDYYIYLPTMLK